MDKRSNNFGFWRARKSFQDLTKEIPNLVFPDMSLLKAKLESIIGGKSVEPQNINNVYKYCNNLDFTAQDPQRFCTYG